MREPDACLVFFVSCTLPSSLLRGRKAGTRHTKQKYWVKQRGWEKDKVTCVWEGVRRMDNIREWKTKGGQLK